VLEQKDIKEMKRKNRATCTYICPPTQLVDIPVMI